MSRFLKVRDNRFLVRDKQTGAILSNDKNGLVEYRKKRNLDEKRQQEIEEIKNDISDIKKALSQILSKLS